MPAILQSGIIHTIAPDPNIDALKEKFQPFAAELGSVVFTWNNLHERLGDLFWAILGGHNGAVPLAIWHSIDSDRTQRKVLKAATVAAVFVRKDLERNAQCRDDILWLIKRIN